MSLTSKDIKTIKGLLQDLKKDIIGYTDIKINKLELKTENQIHASENRLKQHINEFKNQVFQKFDGISHMFSAMSNRFDTGDNSLDEIIIASHQKKSNPKNHFD